MNIQTRCKAIGLFNEIYQNHKTMSVLNKNVISAQKYNFLYNGSPCAADLDNR